MSHQKILAFVFSLLIIAGACKNNDTTDKTPSDIELDTKSAKIVDADNRFGLELFQKINETDTEGKNIMVSPLSVSLALAMTYNGAEGDTREQMEAMLHKSGLTPDDINRSYKTLVAALKSHDVKVALDIANAIYYHQSFSVKDVFLNTNKTYYDAEVKALNFADSKNSLNTINGWVKNKTRNKIETILDDLSPQDVMVLLNAVYFNGEWTYRFDKENTADRDFTLKNGSTKKVPTMLVQKNFNYFGHPQFEMVELPYGGGKYSMLVFLPKEGSTVNQTIGLLSSENINSWIGQMQIREMQVFLPKFEFEYHNKLNDELQALGMVDAFSSGAANLKGINETMQIFISDVIHKSYIKADERGTEAAAVTAVVIRLTAMPSVATFAVNRPFVFAIREKDTNAVLFVGKVLDPLQK